MFHSNLIGGIFAKLCNIKKKIFWNLRHSNLEFGKYIFTILIDFILRLFFHILFHIK